VAGNDRVVLVVGLAGTGKTTALRHAAADLSRQGRLVFGVAPTAKAPRSSGTRSGRRPTRWPSCCTSGAHRSTP
jgi:nucleoside-triphosphatase THEP1